MSDYWRCGLCRDSGIVAIWHPRTIEALRYGETRAPITCGVACKCRRGDPFTTRRRNRGEVVDWLPRFGDAAWHCQRNQRTRQEHDRRDPGGTYRPDRPDWDVEDHGGDALKRFVARSVPTLGEID